MTDYNPADVVLIPFPFTDLSTVKQRPAIILSSHVFNQHHQDAILAAITSHVPEVLTSDEYLLSAEEQHEAGQEQLIHIAMDIFGAADGPENDE